MNEDKLKVTANIFLQPSLIGSARLFPKLPLNQLWKELENQVQIYMTDKEKTEITKCLLRSKRRPINNKLSAGYIRYQKEVGINVINEERNEAIKIIASPTGTLQALVLK